MQNETQNQNIGAQEAKEEAPAQTQAPQNNNQNIGAQEQPQEQQQGIAVGEPDPNGVPDRNVTMNPEDLSGPETAERPGFDDGISIEDISSEPFANDLFGNDNVSPTVEPIDGPDLGVKTAENPSDSLPGDGIDWGPFSWGEDDAWGGCGTFPSEDPSSWPFDL